MLAGTLKLLQSVFVHLPKGQQGPVELFGPNRWHDKHCSSCWIIMKLNDCLPQECR